MDENLSGGYIQLGRRGGGNNRSSHSRSGHISPPEDKFNGVYYALILAGVGFLLPYNSFTIAVDYYQIRYPGTTIVFDISLVYIVMAFFAVLGNNILVETLKLNTRITFGYLLSFFTLFFAIIFGEIWSEVFDPSVTYTITLIAVAVVAIGCTIQQSSFYGYTSMLPSRYTQAVMAGESAAGLLVSLNRIITKILIEDQRVNTLIFFLLSTFMIAVCFALHQFANRTEFVQFYTNMRGEPRKITLEPREDFGLMDPSEPLDSSRSQYGILKLHSSSTAESATEFSGEQYSSLSFANPVYEPRSSGIGPLYKVEDTVSRINGNRRSLGKWKGFKRGLTSRWEVAKCIWPYMLTIGFAYFITLSLYPGIESEISSCRFKTWMPVTIMAMFNASDLAGKVLASIFKNWSKTNMLIFAACRIFLVPLLLLCAMPRGHPYISGEGYPMYFSLALGLTNGIIGSLPMMIAPSKVSEENRELTGNIMTLSYNIGSTAGSLVAYLLHALLGEKMPNLCEDITSAKILSTPTNVTVSTVGIYSTMAAFLFTTAVGVADDLSPPTISILNATMPLFTNVFANSTFL